MQEEAGEEEEESVDTWKALWFLPLAFLAAQSPLTCRCDFQQALVDPQLTRLSRQRKEDCPVPSAFQPSRTSRGLAVMGRSRGWRKNGWVGGLVTVMDE